VLCYDTQCYEHATTLTTLRVTIIFSYVPSVLISSSSIQIKCPPLARHAHLIRLPILRSRQHAPLQYPRTLLARQMQNASSSIRLSMSSMTKKQITTRSRSRKSILHDEHQNEDNRSDDKVCNMLLLSALGCGKREVIVLSRSLRRYRSGLAPRAKWQ